MKESYITKVPDFEGFNREILRAVRKTIPVIVANDSERFFKDNFRHQGWRDTHFRPWRNTRTKSTSTGKNGGILSSTGALKQSITGKASVGKVVVRSGGSRIPYGRIHNEGGYVTIQITEKSRRFFWAMFYKTQEPMWKAMALTKKKFITIRIIQRQFIGKSKMLNEQNEQTIIREFDNIRKKYLS